jgi:hypothetical protein
VLAPIATNATVTTRCLVIRDAPTITTTLAS